MLKLVSISLVALMLSGCISSRRSCRISVANATDVPISSVVVETGGLPAVSATPARSPLRGDVGGQSSQAGRTYEFTDLQPKTMSHHVTVGAGVPRRIVLRIADHTGAVRKVTVDLGRKVPPKFRGRVIFQVGKGYTAKGFVLPAQRGPGGGELPWATPPLWQGAPSIPGLSGGD